MWKNTRDSVVHCYLVLSQFAVLQKGEGAVLVLAGEQERLVRAVLSRLVGSPTLLTHEPLVAQFTGKLLRILLQLFALLLVALHRGIQLHHGLCRLIIGLDFSAFIESDTITVDAPLDARLHHQLFLDASRMALLQVRPKTVLGRILLFTVVTLNLAWTDLFCLGILSLLRWGADVYFFSVTLAPEAFLMAVQIFCQCLLQPVHLLFQFLGPKFYQRPSCNLTQLLLATSNYNM